LTPPRFARLEIALIDKADIYHAVVAMRALATQLQKIAASISDPHLMRLAAHDAIRTASYQTRNGTSTN
jgi:hypothetical protein